MKDTLDLHLSGPGGMAKSPEKVIAVEIDRILGDPVVVNATILPGFGTSEESEIAEAIGRGKALMQSRQLPASQVTKAHRVGIESLLRIEGTATRLPDQFSDTPRRRVLHAKDARRLLSHFAPEIRPIPAVANALCALKFPEGPSAILQDGLTDEQFFLGRLLGELARLEKQPERRRLVLTGSLDESAGADGAMVLAWVSAEAYQVVGGLDRRLVKPAESNRWCPAELDGADGWESKIYRGPKIVRTCNRGSYDTKTFQAWIARDLPLFWESEPGSRPSPVVRVVDRLFLNGAGGISWSTTLWTVAPGTPVRPLRNIPGAWQGTGTVETSDPSKHVFTARIDGFETTKPDSNLTDVRVHALNSGADGTGGVVFVPYPDQMVKMSWSGRFDDPVEEQGQPRVQAQRQAAPALILDDPLKAEFGGVTIAIGPVEVTSQLTVNGHSGIMIGCTDPLILKGDGTTSEHGGGILKVKGGG